MLQPLRPDNGPPPTSPSFSSPLAVSADGAFLLARNPDRGVLEVVRLKDRATVDQLDICDFDDLVTSAAWSADGRRVLAGTWRGLVLELRFDAAEAASAPALPPPGYEGYRACSQFRM